MGWLNRFGKNKAEKITVRSLGGSSIAVKVGTTIFTVTTTKLAELSISEAQGEFHISGRYRNDTGHVAPAAPLARLPNRRAAEECLNLLYDTLSLSKWRWVKRGGYFVVAIFVLSLFKSTPEFPSYAAQTNPSDLNSALAVPATSEAAPSPWAPQPVAENGYVFRPNVQAPKVAVPTLNCDLPKSK